MEIEKLKQIIEKCKSKSGVCRELNYHVNGNGIKMVDTLIMRYNLDISHFNNGGGQVKYELVEKSCPICGKLFTTQIGHKKEKTVCCRGCSNTFFRSGKNHPNYKKYEDIDKTKPYFSKKYRKTCFDNHEHKCVVCGEDKILDVHHFDGNKFNNHPKNLIPICPTHHNYIHSKYKNEVIDKVKEYYNKKIVFNK